MQEEIAQLEVTGESGAGLVKITINGAHNCRRIDIDPSLMEDDKEMLEDLIAAAFNDAVRRAEELQKRKKWRLLPPVCHCRRALKCHSKKTSVKLTALYTQSAVYFSVNSPRTLCKPVPC